MRRLPSLTPPSQEADPNVFIAFAVLLLIAEGWSDRTLDCGGVSGMSKLPPVWPCSGDLKEWQWRPCLVPSAIHLVRRAFLPLSNAVTEKVA